MLLDSWSNRSVEIKTGMEQLQQDLTAMCEKIQSVVERL